MSPVETVEDLRKLVAEMRSLGVSKLKLDGVEVELAPNPNYVPIVPNGNYPWWQVYPYQWYKVTNNGATYLPNNGTYEFAPFPTMTTSHAQPAESGLTYTIEPQSYSGFCGNGVTFSGNTSTVVPTTVTFSSPQK